MRSLSWVLIATLAVWRLTHLLAAEDGPWDLLVRLRRRVGEGFWGGLLDCFYCLSLWIAAPAAWWVGESWTARAVLWPAISGGAILLERLTARPEVPPPPVFLEDPSPEATEEETEDGLLRAETTTDSRGGARRATPRTHQPPIAGATS